MPSSLTHLRESCVLDFYVMSICFCHFFKSVNMLFMQKKLFSFVYWMELKRFVWIAWTGAWNTLKKDRKYCEHMLSILTHLKYWQIIVNIHISFYIYFFWQYNAHSCGNFSKKKNQFVFFPHELKNITANESFITIPVVNRRPLYRYNALK